MGEKRSNFTGKIGFVLAAAGSAVGLGNIWRFPYLAANYGGGIFLLVYIILAITLGFGIMTAEIAIGRKTGLSAVGAFQKLDKRFTWLGYLAALVPLLVTPYYSVIGGWVTKYSLVYLTGQGHNAAQEGFFDNFAGKVSEPLLFFFIFLALTAVIVFLGVEKGIEKVSKIMMPILIFLTVIIAVFVLCQPGALDGVLYYIVPDFSKFSFKTVLAAMGQMFYSMSLAMGIMITYGSYMKKDVNIEKSVHQIEIFDTGIAFLAGLMIIPSVFIFSGGDQSVLNTGPSLMFVTLPKVFDSMEGGHIIGGTFFIMVLFAALTSSISLMETVVSIVHDKLKIGRKVVCVAVFIYCLLVGIPSSLGEGLWSNIQIGGMTILTVFDFLCNSILMPIIAFITCIIIGYVLGPKTVIKEVEETETFKGKKLFVYVIKYIAPVCILIILVSSLLEAFGILKL